jgi:hypothetical protein
MSGAAVRGDGVRLELGDELVEEEAEEEEEDKDDDA